MCWTWKVSPLALMKVLWHSDSVPDRMAEGAFFPLLPITWSWKYRLYVLPSSFPGPRGEVVQPLPLVNRSITFFDAQIYDLSIPHVESSPSSLQPRFPKCLEISTWLFLSLVGTIAANLATWAYVFTVTLYKMGFLGGFAFYNDKWHKNTFW